MAGLIGICDSFFGSIGILRGFWILMRTQISLGWFRALRFSNEFFVSMYLREGQWLAVYLILLASIFGGGPGLPSLTWSHLRLNNKTDSKKNFCHLFGFKPFENDFVNLLDQTEPYHHHHIAEGQTTIKNVFIYVSRPSSFELCTSHCSQDQQTVLCLHKKFHPKTFPKNLELLMWNISNVWNITFRGELWTVANGR